MKKCVITVVLVILMSTIAQAQIPDIPDLKELKGENLINCVFAEMDSSTLILDPSIESPRFMLALEGVKTDAPTLGMEMEILGEMSRARCPNTYDVIGKLNSLDETMYIQLRTSGCSSGEITATAAGLEPRTDNPQRYEDFDEVHIIESVKCEKVNL